MGGVEGGGSRVEASREAFAVTHHSHPSPTTAVQNDILNPAENAKLFAVFPSKSMNVASLKSNLPM